MDYELRRRRERREEYNEETDPGHLAPFAKSRSRTLYEWTGPDARYRSPSPHALDRRRWRIERVPLADQEEDRSTQPVLDERTQDVQEDP